MSIHPLRQCDSSEVPLSEEEAESLKQRVDLTNSQPRYYLLDPVSGSKSCPGPPNTQKSCRLLGEDIDSQSPAHTVEALDVNITDLVTIFERSILNILPETYEGGQSTVKTPLSDTQLQTMLNSDTVCIKSKLPVTRRIARIFDFYGSNSDGNNSTQSKENFSCLQEDTLSQKIRFASGGLSVSELEKWNSFDLARKEQRIQTLLANNEKICAQLKRDIQESIPRPMSMKDYVLDPGKPPLILTRDNTFNVELGVPGTTYEKQLRLLHVENRQCEINYYTDWFSGDEHRNFVGYDKELGPVITSVQLQRREKDGRQRANSRLLIRTRDADEWSFVPSRGKSVEVLSLLKKERPMLAKIKLEKAKNDKIVPQLCQLDNLLGYKQKMKVGVLVVKPDQTDENDMFANSDEFSDAYKEFLQFLGDMIILKDWQGYAGGLDTTNNMTGTHSIYRTFQGHDIMFHVSSMLPLSDGDEQQLERKRHLGNDVICVIWLEEGSHSFEPLCLTTNFTFIFLVVSIDSKRTKECGETYYHIAVASKEGTRPFGPCIPSYRSFKKDDRLLAFLMTKIINSERAAFEAPAFRLKVARTRENLLSEIVKSHR